MFIQIKNTCYYYVCVLNKTLKIIYADYNITFAIYME